MSEDKTLVATAVAFYRLLLYLYPPSFRREFGREMLLVFRDESRFQQARRGPAALPGLWLAFLFDLLSTALVERVREVFAMSSYSFARSAGLGAVLAGLYWIALLFADLSGMTRTDRGGLWVFLAAVGAASIVFLAVALYQQKDYGVTGAPGLALLSVGALLLTLSMVLYAVNFDPEDGAAFGSQFYGHLVSGVGIVLIGFSFRSQGYPVVWSSSLIICGLFLLLFWPLAFVTSYFLFNGELPGASAGAIIYGAAVVVQAAAWIILGMTAFFGLASREVGLNRS